MEITETVKITWMSNNRKVSYGKQYEHM